LIEGRMQIRKARSNLGTTRTLLGEGREITHRKVVHSSFRWRIGKERPTRQRWAAVQEASHPGGLEVTIMHHLCSNRESSP
jgi:hypothetical protein